MDEELKPYKNVKGRGTGSLIKGRYESIQIEFVDEEAQQIDTEVYVDASRSIIARNESPDVGFRASINPYRGCEHGCVYCYARPTHEYFGLSSGLDFETKIFAKLEAAELLRQSLAAKNYQPEVLGMSGVTDCYQPIERDLKLTRACLEVFAECRNPVVVITKNHLVTRDIDILQKLASHNSAHVIISITTLDDELARLMEPRASTPQRRLLTVKELHKARIPVSVNIAPLIPGLTDHEVPTILKEAKASGAASAHYAMIRLPFSVKDHFVNWLSTHYPRKQNKVLHRIEEMRGGKLYDARFGSRMVGEGPYAQHLATMFEHYRRLLGFSGFEALTCQHFRRPNDTNQLSLFVE